MESQSDEKLPHVAWDSTTAPGAEGCMFPDGLTPLECQIAGHPFDGDKHTIGMLVCRQTGHVLKPATKAILGEREIRFYETLKISQDPITAQLKKFVPCYYGTTELQVFNNRIKFLMLKDITKGMAEPCVMDIKIGYRTWDPLATPEKRKTEELKYAESKRTYGFCITGYQVYYLSTGQFKKYDRDYGKQLSVAGVKQALQEFLNMRRGTVCQPLISELLTQLYKIERFFNMQRKYCFYSSSLLVAYDAEHIRQHCPLYDEELSHFENFWPFEPRPDAPITWHPETMPEKELLREYFSSFLPEIKDIKPRIKKSVSGPVSMPCEQKFNQSESCNSGDRLCRSSPSQFSFSHTNDVTKKDDENVSAKKDCEWVRVKMIDFTHVFPGDDSDLDRNYLDGIESLIQLLSRIKKNDCMH